MRLDEIAATYQEQMDFYCIYIKEAHPEDNVGGYRTKVNTDEDIFYNQPTTISERADLAEVCVLRLNFKMPMLLDNMTNEVESKYVAEPERLFVISEAGILSYISVRGVFGFKPDEWEAAIREQLRLPALD